MQKVFVEFHFFVLLISNACNCYEQSKEISLLPSKILGDTQAASSDIRKIFVDIETDLLSAISPVTFSGTQYPWKILSPAVAKAQHDALSLENTNRRALNLNTIEVLSSNLDDVNFFLYQDRRNFNYSIRIDLGEAPQLQGIYQVPRGSQVKILIHGFQSAPHYTFVQESKDAYLRETSNTVIAVDWENLAFPKNKISLLLYPAVTENAFKVGEKVATLIEYLLQNGVIADLSQIHILGHSLGAHSAGYAGDLIQSRYGQKIGRITALDAAFLAFIGPNVKRRLDKNDAKFVDAIHTSGIGVYDAIAHADFYPNGGRNQASCYNSDTYRANARDSELTRTFEKILQSCSHARAYHFYTKTIKRENMFWSCKCVSWKDYRTYCRDSCNHRELFGEYVAPTARGKYFLDIDP